MNIIFKVSLRNLLRQKRRNFFLGIGIAFGMSILVIASSFSQGLVDVLIKDLISSVTGHVQINGNEKPPKQKQNLKTPKQMQTKQPKRRKPPHKQRTKKQVAPSSRL